MSNIKQRTKSLLNNAVPQITEKDVESFIEITTYEKIKNKENKGFPIGGGLWTRLHPEDIITSPYKEWTFNQNTTRMPEFAVPGLGKKSNVVTLDLDNLNIEIAIEKFKLSDINIYADYYTGHNILNGDMFYYSKSIIQNGVIVSENKLLVKNPSLTSTKKGRS